MTTLRSWNAMGRWSLVVRLAAVGALAGFASWGLVFAGHLFLGTPKPSGISLALAVPRGALVGVVLALVLRAYWNRHARQGGSNTRL